MSIVVIRKPREFVEEFLDQYLADGFGAMPKREVDILIMHLLLKYAGLDVKSNQELSVMLQTTESRIRSLQYECRLKYPPDPDYVRREFLYVLSKAQVDFERRKVVFAIENEYLRHAIQGRLKERGMFADSSFNSELIKIDQASLESVIGELYDGTTVDDFHDGFEEMRKQLEGREASPGWTAAAFLGRLALDTAVRLGFEVVKSRLGI